MKVALIFTTVPYTGDMAQQPLPSRDSSLANGSSKRVREREQHCDTDTDQERGVDQTSQQEHLGLQLIHQFRLTCRCLDELATHDANTNTGANCTQPNDQATGQRNKSDVRHDYSFRLLK
jgi:hypothetical protein